MASGRECASCCGSGRGGLPEVAGRPVTIASTEDGGATAPQAPAAGAEPGDRKKPADLKAEAMADAAVQAMLDVFPAEISDVEEM